MDRLRQLIPGLTAPLAALLLALLAPWPGTAAAAKSAARPAEPAAAPAAPLALFKDATFLLPAGAKVETHWVLSPTRDDGGQGFSFFSVDADGNPVLATSGYIVKPAKRYMVALEPYELQGMTQLANGVLLLATNNEIGFLAPPAKPALNKERLPIAGFQPLVSVPVRQIELLASAGNTVYCAGPIPGSDRYALYRLRTVKGAGIRDLERLFVSPAAITAVTGDQDAVFAALGRTVVRISLRDGGVTTVYTHPTDEIDGLALTPAGLVASTGTDLVLVGLHGGLEIMRSSGHVLYQRGARLYVLFRRSTGVLALDNLADLKRFDLDVRPVAPGETAPPLAVTGIRFFESGPPPSTRRAFADSFERKAVRRIVGDIAYRAEGPLKKTRRHLLTVSWFEPTGGRLKSADYMVEVGPKARSGEVLAAIGGEKSGGYIPRSRGKGGMIWRFGNDDLGTHYPGRYRVRVQVDGIPVAGDWGFTISGPVTLVEALVYNDPAMVRTLLAHGLNPRVRDDDGNLPLNQAVMFGTTGMVEMMLNAGADPNQTDKDGVPALAKANPTWAPDWRDKAELLIRHGANVNAAADAKGQPLLFSMSFDPDYTLFLIEHGANINVRDIYFKETPAQLLQPMGFCQDPVLSALIRRGANVSTTTNAMGETPLADAISVGDVDCVKLLLSKGVSQTANDIVFDRIHPGTSHTALFIAIGYLGKASPEKLSTARRIVDLLVENGATLRPDEGWIMLRGNAPEFFDRAALARALDENGEALLEASQSKEPAIREMALQHIPSMVRRMMPTVSEQYQLVSVDAYCRAGFRLVEARYRPIHLDLRLPDFAKPGPGPGKGRTGMGLLGRPGGGAYVVKVESGGAAERAGLRAGDIILGTDGQPAKNAAAIAAAINGAPPDSILRLDGLRDDSMRYPGLVLACGLLEKALDEKDLADMNLRRWLAANPKAEQASSVQAMLDGRPWAVAGPSWGSSPEQPGSAGCSMQ